MAIDPEAIRARVRREGRVIRVVVAEVRGSAPREPGAWMTVGPGGTEGTIGGGTLEHEAIRLVRGARAPRLLRRSLGPELGQCCGGNVTLVMELFDAAALDAVGEHYHCRPVIDGAAKEMPLTLHRIIAAARSQGAPVSTRLIDGWLLEPVAPPARALWIWGAGHVGRALVVTLSPLPEFAITWIDTGPERFPKTVPEGVEAIPAADPAVLAAHAPETAEHLVLTYSHAIDLAICDALLRRGFARAGLIGSRTKWSRFRKRLAESGHSDAHISRIDCPIGDPALGKHPQAIAVGVAAGLLKETARKEAKGERIA
ncbi:MAG: xanthine dehydrogenase accessory protein XdhC [Pseudooceanicola sp.]